MTNEIGQGLWYVYKHSTMDSLRSTALSVRTLSFLCTWWWWNQSVSQSVNHSNSQIKTHTSFTFTFSAVSSQWDFSYIYYFYFFICIVSMGFLSWEIQAAFPGESQLQQSCITQPPVHAGCFSVSIIHRTLTWTTGPLTCVQMLLHAIAHWVVWTHVRECTESWLWEKNPLPHREVKPTSVAWQSDALTNWYK